MSTAVTRDETPVALEGGGVELRMKEIGGDLTVAFVHLPEGTDLGPALTGQPDDRCQVPHWGYIFKGRLQMRTADGDEVYEEGQAFYWRPGHVPVALSDVDYMDFSPSAGFRAVVDHVRGRSG
ncbi:hypothetical protein DEJ50_28000 [Streptomyces venezuelae]|uniref:Cupin domain-containing protein n=1 Tax=Streptomyces venezuelae TaxID=54571 RepID=A0A5P2D994_STRVZ|nr:hypothetical protein [Streptomyces venezuelae]QES51110.1 hypothetical protein DEJ50_28000 [Streptomyces venezuelae]